MSLARVVFPDPSGPRIATRDPRSICPLRSLMSGLPARYAKETEERLIMGGRGSEGLAQTDELLRPGRACPGRDPGYAGPYGVLVMRYAWAFEVPGASILELLGFQRIHKPIFDAFFAFTRFARGSGWRFLDQFHD